MSASMRAYSTIDAASSFTMNLRVALRKVVTSSVPLSLEHRRPVRARKRASEHRKLHAPRAGPDRAGATSRAGRRNTTAPPRKQVVLPPCRRSAWLSFHILQAMLKCLKEKCSSIPPRCSVSLAFSGSAIRLHVAFWQMLCLAHEAVAKRFSGRVPVFLSDGRVAFLQLYFCCDRAVCFRF
jgi:hypothetical protein